MFNLCDNRIQLVLYATTVTIMALGVFYVCLGSFIIGEFLPLLPSVFENPLWGLFYLYLIFTGVYTVVAAASVCAEWTSTNLAASACIACSSCCSLVCTSWLCLPSSRMLGTIRSESKST
ncbi:hypothetical protein BOX15_Mlig005376g1 [Macrostomum lignano]|uniref:Uncharacterized protein n=1 Tax=Macrostomum lignano TaxID=282301 RepID=A0A267E3Q5_9PLAT|nr:hypothetical protein BOX15_Mlig005376g1 [Macrostomum lignano]